MGWDKIEEYILSDNTVIKTVAEDLINYKKQREKGEISDSEFKDLVGDLLNLELIDQTALSLEAQTQLAAAVSIMQSVAAQFIP